MVAGCMLSCGPEFAQLCRAAASQLPDVMPRHAPQPAPPPSRVLAFVDDCGAFIEVHSWQRCARRTASIWKAAC